MMNKQPPSNIGRFPAVDISTQSKIVSALESSRQERELSEDVPFGVDTLLFFFLLILRRMGKNKA